MVHHEESSLKPLDFIMTLLSLLEIKPTSSIFLRILTLFSIILYFAQMICYLVKPNLNLISDNMLSFIFNVFFYSNFSNFLYYFSINWLTTLFLIIAYVWTLAIPLYIIIRTIIMKKTKAFFIENSSLITILDHIIHWLLVIFPWVLQLPTLEIFINVLDCDNYSFYNENRGGDCPKTSELLMILSILSCILNVVLGLLIVSIFRNYEFFNVGATNPLKSTNSVLFVIIYGLKCLFPLCYPIMKYYQSIYIIIFFIIAALSLLDFIKRPPFRERLISRVYISCLMAMLVILIVDLFLIYTDIIQEQSYIYHCGLLILLLIKFGFALCAYHYFKRLVKDFGDIKCLDYLSEEVLILQYGSELSRRDRLLGVGLLKKHAKYCQNRDCKLKMKHLQNMNFMHSEEFLNNKIMHFIAQEFSLKLKAIIRKSEDSQYFEPLLLKYISFLINSKWNSLKAYYELQKFKTSSQKTPSFYFRIVCKLLKRIIKQKIHKNEFDKIMKNDIKASNEVKVTDFFRIEDEKKILEKKTKKLLNEKLKFWERFKDGFKSYEDLIKLVYSFIEKIKGFKRFLDKTLSTNGLISLKFYSILHSLLLNSINDSMKYEDEIDNFKKRCFSVDKEAITNLSFFNKDIAICQVSLLNLKGQLLETGKSHRLAQIFGYQQIDLKNIRYITHFMPPSIASKHEMMVYRSLNRESSEYVTSKNTVSSFAIDKKGFIFKIRVFFSQCFQFQMDFVMNAAIMKIEENGNRPCVIFDNDGTIQGMNEEFFMFLRQEYEIINKNMEKSRKDNNEITLQDFSLLNIWALIPKIKEILTENEVFKEKVNQTIRNETAVFDFPENLMEIIEKLRSKKKEAEISERSNTHSLSRYTLNSIRTAKSKASNLNNKDNGKSPENLNKLKNSSIKDNNSNSGTGRENLNKVNNLKNSIKDNNSSTLATTLNPEQIILQYSGDIKRFRVSFDMVVQCFHFGKKDLESIILINLQLLKVQAMKKDYTMNKQNTENKNQKLNVNYIENSLKTIKTDAKPITTFIETNPFTYTVKENTNNSNVKNQVQDQDPLTKRNTNRNNEEDDIVNENPSSFVKFPPDNSVAFHDFDFGRKINEDLPLDEEKKLNDSFINQIQPISTNKEQSHLSIISEEIEKEKAKFKISQENQNFESVSNSQDKIPNTTERHDLPDLLEKQSQKASSITSMKKTFGIFNIIKAIQQKTPIAIKYFMMISISEILVISIYCIILFYLSVSYISNDYLPLQQSMIDFCRSSVDFNFGVLSISQYEFWYYNFTTSRINGSLWNEYGHIINETLTQGSQVLYEEMNQPINFLYQTDLLTTEKLFIDYITKTMSNITYIPMFQFFMEVLSEFNGATPAQVFANTEYMNILQRNYYYFYQINNIIINAIQSDFQNSNNTVTVQFENTMIVLIAIFAVFGILKMLQFSLYNTRIMKILNIILRMQSMQIFNEINLYKEMLKIMDDPFDSYLNLYFSEKVINSKSLMLDDAKEAVLLYEKNEVKASKKAKEKKFKQSVKKTSLLNIKPISKLRPLIYIIVIFIIAFAVLYSNYYMWSNTNDTITDLITVNINFNKLYYYSAFMLIVNDLMIREKIIRDPAYEKSGEPTQTEASRLSSFNKSYIARLANFDSYISSISTYGIGIQNDYNDDEYNEILTGNLCQVLNNNQMINAYELKYCNTGLNNAFLQGLPGLLNEFRNNLLALTNMTNLVPANDTINTKIQINIIKSFISSKNITDINMGGYVLCKSVLIFYNKVNDYYYNLLNQNINSFIVFLMVTSCFCALFFAMGAILSLKYLKLIYMNVSWSLMLIPYDKLINDEQISFLIKNISREK